MPQPSIVPRSVIRLLPAVALLICISATARAQSPVRVTLQQTNGVCDRAVTGQLVLSAPAPPGGVEVALSSSATAVIPRPAPVTIAAGAMSAPLRLPCLPPIQSQAVTITATVSGTSASATVTMLAPVLTSFSLKPVETTTTSGASVTTAMVAGVGLLGPAPQGGVIVTLLNSDPSLIGIPATVTVPAGAASANVDVRFLRAVPRATAFTITATGLGVSKMVADTVEAPVPIRLEVASPVGQQTFRSATTVASGQTMDVRIVIRQAAPSDGLNVALTSSSPKITVPATVHVPPEDTVVQFTIPAATVSTPERVTLRATSGGITVTREFTIGGIGISGLTISHQRVVGGEPATGVIMLSTRVRGAPLEVRLTSSDPVLATVPALVSIPDGATTATFPVTTTGGGREAAVTITGSSGDSRGTATVTIEPTRVTRVSLMSTVRGGAPVTMVLTAPDRHTGFTASLTADSASLLDLPATVRFAANESRKELSITTRPVIAPTRVVVSAARGTSRPILILNTPQKGAVAPVSGSVSATVTLTPPVVTGVSLSRTGIEGGAGEVLQGTVTLDTPAPAGFGRFVGLRSTLPAVVLTGVQFAQGSSTGVFELRANAVSADQNGLIEAFLQSDPRRVTVPIRVVRRR
jgi:hypothetical protein